MRKCPVEGCEKRPTSHRMCEMHDGRMRRNGTLDGPHRRTLREIFDANHTTAVDACWEWSGRKNNHGYGHMYAEGRAMYAHRLAYELYVGPIPEGWCVCHMCDNPGCVNPLHLFLGTHQDNMDDMASKGRHGGPPRKTHCLRGHAIAGYNCLILRQGKGMRRACRECMRLRTQGYRAAKRAG